MTPMNPLFLPEFSAIDEESDLSAINPPKSRWSIVRSVLYTAIITFIVSITIYYGQEIDPNLSVFFSAHLALLVLFFAGSLVVTITRRLFSEDSLFLFIILDGLFFGYYSYVMTIHYFSVLFPAFIQYIAIIIAIGSVFLLFIGYAFSSR